MTVVGSYSRFLEQRAILLYSQFCQTLLMKRCQFLDASMLTTKSITENSDCLKDDGVRLGETEKAKPLLAKTFEDTLYKIFKPKNESRLTNGSAEAPQQ
jgi:hypothetical protein